MNAMTSAAVKSLAKVVNKENADWYKELIDNLVRVVEDYKATAVSLKVEAMTRQVETMHKVGEMIATSSGYRKGAKGNAEFVEKCGEDCGVGRTDANYCVKFYLKYPAVNKFLANEVPEATHPNWSHVKELLSGKPTVCKHEETVTITIKAERCEECKKVVHRETTVK